MIIRKKYRVEMGHIVHIGKRIGVDYSRTYSCYRGGEKHCGVCGTCNERKEAMRDAGLHDPTAYLQ